MTGKDMEPESMKIDFGQMDFSDDSNRLFNLGGDRFRELCYQVESINLIVPMQYSMIKLLEIDNAGLEKYGQDFIDWEASQQLPEELGKFRFGYNRLGPSFDQQRVKYLFWAAPENLIGRLIDFLGLPEGLGLVCQSEAMGLYLALNHCSEHQGFNAAMAIEQEGVSVVLSHDGDFIGAKYIGKSGQSLKDEIMYYVIGAGSDSLKPQILLCGDYTYKGNLGDLHWAEMLMLESPAIPLNNSIYFAAFGLALGD
jgi:hypothetical protein